jgi:hypothetical protein
VSPKLHALFGDRGAKGFGVFVLPRRLGILRIPSLKTKLDCFSVDGEESESVRTKTIKLVPVFPYSNFILWL